MEMRIDDVLHIISWQLYCLVSLSIAVHVFSISECFRYAYMVLLSQMYMFVCAVCSHSSSSGRFREPFARNRDHSKLLKLAGLSFAGQFRCAELRPVFESKLMGLVPRVVQVSRAFGLESRPQ